MNFNRRRFLATSAAALAASTQGTLFTACSQQPEETTSGTGGNEPLFQISLAQWSLHKALKAGELDNLDWPKFTKETFGIEAVEWVNQFFYVEHETLG
ncbi:MAG TPA: hypothetical protein PLA50_20665, partial [Bacteroidia bacterium]|nr:hypothetical protein [Bacteroidia bacterium]